MTKRTYISENYSPETQEAMRTILGSLFDPNKWSESDLLHVIDIADVIEKAVNKAKRVTEEQVRVGCASVAEAQMKQGKSTNPYEDFDREYVTLIRDKINKGKLGPDSPIIAALIRVIDSIIASAPTLLSRIEELEEKNKGIEKLLPEVCHDNLQLKAENAELRGEGQETTPEQTPEDREVFSELKRLEAKNAELVEVLKDIDKRKGLYKGITFKHLRDQLNYANDTIDKMTQIARTALAKHGSSGADVNPNREED